MKPSIFIGSSGESLDVAYAVQEELENSAEVTIWNQGVFQLSRSILEGLLTEIHRTEFCLFVFAPDDVARIRNTEHLVVRDNVVFELGAAMSVLGRERSFILQPRDVVDFHLPSDLLGIEIATYDPHRGDRRIRAAVAPACNRIRQAMEKVRSPKVQRKQLAFRAGISGAMSVGKKTLAGELSRRIELRPDIDQVVTYRDVGRELIAEGRTADQTTSFGDYAAYFSKHLKNLSGRPTGCALHVRTVFDTIGYAEVNDNFTGEWMDMARDMAHICAEKFDLYFYVPIEPRVPIVDDGIRSTDVGYRSLIDSAIRRILREFVPGFVEVRGSLEERTIYALNEIERFACRPRTRQV